MSSLNDELMKFLKNYVPSTGGEGGSFSETDSTSSASPATFALATQDTPLTFETSLAAPATTSLNILEGATISGGSPVSYNDVGPDTGGGLATINLSPTISTRGLLAVSLLQAGVANIGSIILKPNTTYVFEVTNTSITAEPARLGGVFRRL